jgi:hypothetical protein
MGVKWMNEFAIHNWVIQRRGMYHPARSAANVVGISQSTEVSQCHKKTITIRVAAF